MAAKTPYEIRLDLLQLAQRILSEKHHAMAAALAKGSHDNTIFITTSASAEEIIAEADKLNGFVSKANSAPTH